MQISGSRVIIYALIHEMRLIASALAKKIACTYKQDAPSNEKIRYYVIRVTSIALRLEFVCT
jgi:hypothetical protein